LRKEGRKGRREGGRWEGEERGRKWRSKVESGGVRGRDGGREEWREGGEGGVGGITVYVFHTEHYSCLSINQ